MRVYFGWYIVAISVLALALTIGGSIQAFGLFVIPVSEEFELTRADVNTGAILFNIGMAMMGPIVGRVLDKRSAKATMMVSAILFGTSLVALGASHSVWLSAVIILIPLAAAVVGCGTVTSPTLVARWFHVYRARALAIAMLGISLGPVIMVPLISLLMEAIGWRQSLMVVGGALGGLLLFLALLVREAPGPGDIEVRSRAGTAEKAAPGADGGDASLGIGELLQLPKFWTISVGIGLAFGIIQVLILSLVPFGQGTGLSLTQAASLLSMYGGGAILGTLVLAWLGDRLDRLNLLIGLIPLLAAVGASLLFVTTYPVVLLCTGFLGFVGGMITPAYLALLADQFGTASFGTANGCASLLSTVIGAGCIRVGGELFDKTGSYDLTFISIGLAGIVATALMFITKPLARMTATRR